MCSEQTEYFENKHCFASMLVFRGAFLAVYSGYNIGNAFAEDKAALQELKEQIDTLINSGEIKDRIVLLQTKYFSDNLQSILDKM